MSVKRTGLGRNLSALLSRPEGISENSYKTEEGLLTLNVNDLQPGKYQPRKDMDDDALTELSLSIKQQGLLQPLVVRQIATGRYEIIAGERRFRACQLIGLTTVPALLRQVDDETAMIMALIENMQREGLNVMDEARAMLRLTNEFSLTHQEVADVLCKSRAAVSNVLRLLNLDSDVMRMLEHGDLDMGHARCLLTLEKNQQNFVAKIVIAKDLSVRETEKLVARVKEEPTSVVQEVVPPLFELQVQRLSQQLHTKVSIKPGKSGKGMLIIHYDDTQNLEKVIESLVGSVV